VGENIDGDSCSLLKYAIPVLFRKQATWETSSGSADNDAKIRTQHLSNTSLDRKDYKKLLGEEHEKKIKNI
jgi:hypothetical protein